jgi:hypothetical protein
VCALSTHPSHARRQNPDAKVSRLANTVGTAEPEYGPEALQSVTAQAEKTPFTEVTKADLKWKAMQATNVETQIFYLISNEGKVASVQIIYNNVAYVVYTFFSPSFPFNLPRAYHVTPFRKHEQRTTTSNP